MAGNLIDTYSQRTNDLSVNPEQGHTLLGMQGEAVERLIPWRNFSGHLLTDLTHSEDWDES